MANEPERPIEELLRAAAKKRRDEAGAPLELHPATRRLLQGEAARKFARTQGASRSLLQVLGQLWPRFAWGVGMLAVLAVTVWLLVPAPGKKEPQTLLAKNQPIFSPSPTAIKPGDSSYALAPSPSPPLEERAGERRPSAPTPLISLAVTPGPPKEALPPPPVAPTAAPAPLAPAEDTKALTVAFADASPAARRKPAFEVAAQPEPLPKDSPVSVTGGEVHKKLALAAAPQLANRDQAPGTEVAASSRMIAPAPTRGMNGASAQPFGSVGRPAPPAAAPAALASSSTLPAVSGVAGVVPADESKRLSVDRAAQGGFAYKSLPAAASENAPRPSAAPTDGRLDSAVALRKEASSITATQWFAQMLPSPNTERSLADKAAPAHPVLAAFQVEQAGRELRIVDGDGSVYSGYLQIADAARRRTSAKAEEPAASLSYQAPGALREAKSGASLNSDQLAPQTYFFRVAGTNRSLKQKVVFTGNFLAATNLALSQPATNNFTLGGSLVGYRGVAPQPGLLPLHQSRISGKVVIGTSKPVEINALPTSP